MQKETEELTCEKETVVEDIRAVHDEQALASAEVSFAQESLADIRRDLLAKKSSVSMKRYDEKKKALDDELTEKRNESSLLSTNLQRKKNEGVTLDKQNETKRKILK